MVELPVARSWEWDVNSTETKKYTQEAHKNPQTPPKRLIWIGTDTQISLGKHSLGQNNDIAATCDSCLLEQQAFHHTSPWTQTHLTALCEAAAPWQPPWAQVANTETEHNGCNYTETLLPLLGKLTPRLAWLALEDTLTSCKSFYGGTLAVQPGCFPLQRHAYVIKSSQSRPPLWV